MTSRNTRKVTQTCPWIFPQTRKSVVPLMFSGNLILRICFCAIVNENKKAAIVERRFVSNHIPLRPKHWFAINARDFAPVVGHLRFGGSVFVRISAANKTTTTINNEQDVPNMKRALANPLHASDMLSFRILHCGSDVSMQKLPKFARVLWVRGHVAQVCCEMVFCHVRSCVPAKRGFQRATTSLPKLVVTKMGD